MRLTSIVTEEDSRLHGAISDKMTASAYVWPHALYLW
jgi:hypothetical protein